MLGGKAVFNPWDPLLLLLSLAFRAFGLQGKLQDSLNYGTVLASQSDGTSGSRIEVQSLRRQGHYHGYSKAQNLIGCIVGVGGKDGGK